MFRLCSGLVAGLAVSATLLLGAGQSDAQTVVVTPAPTVTYYAPAPTVTYYAPAPAVTYYAPAPVVAPPAAVTTYRYRVLPRRVVTRTYYYAPAPVVAVRPTPVVRYYRPAYIYP